MNRLSQLTRIAPSHTCQIRSPKLKKQWLWGGGHRQKALASAGRYICGTRACRGFHCSYHSCTTIITSTQSDSIDLRGQAGNGPDSAPLDRIQLLSIAYLCTRARDQSLTAMLSADEADEGRPSRSSSGGGGGSDGSDGSSKSGGRVGAAALLDLPAADALAGGPAQPLAGLAEGELATPDSSASESAFGAFEDAALAAAC